MTISLRPSVRDALFAYASESGDGLETAGFLFGDRYGAWRTEMSVRWVSRMVQKRGAQSVRVDIEALVREKEALGRRGADHIEDVGCWHTHTGTQDGRPSEADLQMWLNSRDFLNRASYVGLILTAVPQFDRWGSRDDLWLRSDVHAWVVRRDGPLERAVCDPAAVKFS